MTLETTRPLEPMAHPNGSTVAAYAVTEAPVNEQERRCAQDLLVIMGHMKRVITHDREGSGLPITTQQYHVLKLLNEQALLISELADIFKVSRPTMTRIVDGLEGRRRPAAHSGEEVALNNRERRAKLVERVDSPDDRRLVYARITQEGRAMLGYYCTKSEESVTAVLRRISDDQIPLLERSLQILRQALESE